MSRVAKLIMVTAHNNNKYYNMREEGGTIHVSYGRVGSTEAKTSYPSSKWNSLIRSKTRKGYKDVTELHLEEKSIDFEAISDDVINQFVAQLQAYANKSIQSNYTVSSEAVTEKQVEEAQRIVDLLMAEAKNHQKTNTNLLQLFQIIPRKMSRVQDYLVDTLMTDDDVNKLIAREQATLDVMKGQVNLNAAKKQNKVEDKKTILEAMGLEIVPATEDDIKTIKSELGEISNTFSKAFKVVNKRTQERFDKHLDSVKDKTCQMFWHGSRNENWWSILDTGLILRPTNAVITGKMFGYGLYFADKARKSYGYTSCRNSYWARGSSDKGFMALYKVHLGKTLTAKRRESWMGNATDADLRRKGDYDSLTALGGADLRNNEFIVYNEEQCTVQYIVELN